ncbi:hypothetical protein GCM10010359_33600 [Streptomyces morookaense]|nr:hypothetical protein GCM10010359_33600 [Streptomyces morookaense]
MPVAFEANSARSGASSAHPGSPVRGARKRFSQSGMDALLSVMPPFCAGGTTSCWGLWITCGIGGSVGGGEMTGRTRETTCLLGNFTAGVLRGFRMVPGTTQGLDPMFGPRP